jgi:macrolide transport system ATP-binding/permease protein
MSWRNLLASFKRGRKADREIEDEMRFHLEKQVELHVAAGMSPEEARRQALIEFGGVHQARENVRETRGIHLLDVIAQDTRYAWRLLRKTPVFTSIAVLTLALGIGMNTAIFSLIDGVLFRNLPAHKPEELVLLKWHAHKRPQLMSQRGYGYCESHFAGTDYRSCSFSLPWLKEVSAQKNLFSDVAAMAGGGRINLSGNGPATILNGAQLVSGSFFQTIGVPASLGRTLLPADDNVSAPAVMVISYGYWKSAFGGMAETVGKTVRLNGVPFTIVGVMARDFSGITAGDQIDVWVPLASESRLDPGWTAKDDDYQFWKIDILARLNPGVQRKQAQTVLTGMFRNHTFNTPKPLFQPGDDPGIDVPSAKDALYYPRAQTMNPLYVAMTAVAVVLLIACANIGGLLLTRSAARSREIAVRLTLGARRGRIVTQLLFESLILSLAGGGLGLLIGRWGSRAIILMVKTEASDPPPFRASFDWRVLAFTFAVALIAAILFGLAPALRSLRVDLSPALKSGSAASAGDARQGRWLSLGSGLVVAQVTLAIVALMGAGLLLRTLTNLKSVDLGFDPNNVLLFGVDPSLAGYKPAQIHALNQELQEKFAALPSVKSVSYSWEPLLAGSLWDTDFHPAGTPEDHVEDTDYMPVGPGFFEAMRIPLKVGRDFNAADYAITTARDSRPRDASPDPSAPPIPVIVNETFARKFLGNTNPIDQHLEQGMPEDKTEPRGSGWRIIGVAGDTKYDGLRADVRPVMYAPLSSGGFFTIRTAGDPRQLVPAIRDLVTRRDSNLAIYRVSTQMEQLNGQMHVERLLAQLSAFFGVLALVLACGGIYGLLSYEVTRRTREIGIRMAIGAQRVDVIRMVVRQGIILSLIGVVAGAAAAFGATRIMNTVLYHVKAMDPLTLAAVSLLLLLVSLLACLLPARRATRVDPLIALRYE